MTCTDTHTHTHTHTHTYANTHYNIGYLQCKTVKDSGNLLIGLLLIFSYGTHIEFSELSL